MHHQLKLNLGYGNQLTPGYVNVDKFGHPDVRFDLETFPWPWPDNSVEEVVFNHVLEHLGRTSEIYLRIIKEIYRVCANGARIYITVPHPRHNDFVNDPTHVRAITVEGLMLFSKEVTRDLTRRGCADSPLADYLDVDFRMDKHEFILDDYWTKRLAENFQSEAQLQDELFHAIRTYTNVVKELKVVLSVIKTVR